MKFRTWFEEDMDKQADMAPASAEVVKTGLQPQVDAQEIHTGQKEENDTLMALDGHFQRIKETADKMESGDSERLQQLKDFCQNTLNDWEQIKRGKPPQGKQQGAGLGSFQPPQRQLDYMTANQPLPDDPRAPRSLPSVF